MKNLQTLVVVVVGTLACDRSRTGENSHPVDRAEQRGCHSLVVLRRPGSVVDLDDSARVLVRAAPNSYVWEAGKLTEFPPDVEVKDMNNLGDVVGASGSSAFMWQKGALREIPTLGRRAIAHAINDLGHAVGGYEDDDGKWHAFMFREGTTTELAFRDRSVVAVGINATDDVVAREVTPPGHTFVLRKDEVFELDAQFLETALQINAPGQVLGNVRGSDGHVHAMLWTDGALRDLVPGRGRDVWAARLNDRGDVVGHTDEVLPAFPFKTELPFRVRGGVFEPLDAEGFLAGAPLDLDERGNVVGHLFWRTGSRAALWNEGRATVLPDLSGTIALHPSAVADRINEGGVIAGSDVNGDGVRQPFVLIPNDCSDDAGPPIEEPTEN